MRIILQYSVKNLNGWISKECLYDDSDTKFHVFRFKDKLGQETNLRVQREAIKMLMEAVCHKVVCFKTRVTTSVITTSSFYFQALSHFSNSRSRELNTQL